jgi:hypothetical protein
MMRIYCASSWRNTTYPSVIKALRGAGHIVYDFREPLPGETGFAWRQVCSEDRRKDPRVYRDEMLAHPLAKDAFHADMTALRSAEVTVLVLPCGRSAHLELGYAVGAKQKTIVLLDEPISEPELMYLMCTSICLNIDEVIATLGVR